MLDYKSVSVHPYLLLVSNAPRTFFLGGGDFIKSLTLTFNAEKCEFCAET